MLIDHGRSALQTMCGEACEQGMQADGLKTIVRIQVTHVSKKLDTPRTLPSSVRIIKFAILQCKSCIDSLTLPIAWEGALYKLQYVVSAAMHVNKASSSLCVCWRLQTKCKIRIQRYCDLIVGGAVIIPKLYWNLAN